MILAVGVRSVAGFWAPNAASLPFSRLKQTKSRNCVCVCVDSLENLRGRMFEALRKSRLEELEHILVVGPVLEGKLRYCLAAVCQPVNFCQSRQVFRAGSSNCHSHDALQGLYRCGCWGGMGRRKNSSMRIVNVGSIAEQACWFRLLFKPGFIPWYNPCM